ncbi:MAG: FG-GAP-like repeat-containing protein [Bryobacteraceae bacterium]
MRATSRVSFGLCLLVCLAATNPNVEEQLWRYRNLGKAFYENPTTQVEAIDTFRKALDLAPDSIREQLNYALALLHGGRTEEAVARLQKVQAADPGLPHTWFNLGIYYRKNGSVDKATAQFEAMSRLVPNEPKAHYNLGVLYKEAGRTEDARNELEFTERLDPNLAAPHFQLYNVYRQAGRRADALRELQAFTALKKSQEGAPIAEDMEWCDYAEIWDPIDMQPPPPEQAPRYETRTLPGHVDSRTAGMLVIDSEGTGRADLLVWSAEGIALYRNGVDPVKNSGLEDVTGVIGVAAGDFDNDGLPDLCILTAKGPQLWRNRKGRFERVPANLPAERFEKAVWIDYDHDYDLDLVLLGETSRLYRNEGQAGFADRTADFPFRKGHALDAVVTRMFADSKAFDLVVSYTDHPGVVYLDKLGERFEAQDIPALPAGATGLRVADVNHDAWLDVQSDGGTLLNNRGRLEPASAKFEAAPLEADFDNDGRLDRAVITPDGRVRIEFNRTPAKEHDWLRVQIVGVKNLKLGYGAEVEVKAGTLYQKKIYEGVPLTFDLHGRTAADTVRIAWANGLIQNETQPAAGKGYVYPEAQRLSGSCPMIWARDASGRFRFITDVLGVAPLGASSGDGQFFPVDHQEYIQLPGEALAPVDGKYEIRITEELSEVAFVDQVHLIAVDHPADVEIFTNEKWKSPPYPEFRLFGARRRVFPIAARDDQGRDSLQAVLSRDRIYPNAFQHDMNGVAEMHSLVLDFGPNAAPDNRAVLILNGWVDWADGSTFLAAAQERKGGLVSPYLQVKDERGQWKTVIADMGIPAGKPKTIAVDLTGKFLSPSREVRIVTNLCVYWDQVFLDEDSSAPPALVRRVPTTFADLHFRGFSKPVISADRSQPEEFLYDTSLPFSNWNPTPGLYTQYGDVRELLEEPDDMFVVMGSGDEIRLLFDAGALPPPAAGWKRDFLLKVDGWAKDRDANTAFSQSVEPLPFHAMTGYPYASPEHYPEDARHREYRKKYNTRPALRLIRPLNDQTAAAGAVPLHIHGTIPERQAPVPVHLEPVSGHSP